MSIDHGVMKTDVATANENGKGNRMTILTDINANASNAAHSTRTGAAAERSDSTLEALKGVTFARIRILPNEDVAAFDALQDSMEVHFRPVGPIEEYLVDLIVDDRWRLGRLAGAEAVGHLNSQNLAYLSDRHNIIRTDVNAAGVDTKLRLLVALEDAGPPGDSYAVVEKDPATLTKVARAVPLGWTFLNSYAAHSSGPCADIARERRELTKDIQENSRGLYAEQRRRRAETAAITASTASAEAAVER
jgi:hypothetical protein